MKFFFLGYRLPCLLTKLGYRLPLVDIFDYLIIEVKSGETATLALVKTKGLRSRMENINYMPVLPDCHE